VKIFFSRGVFEGVRSCWMDWRDVGFWVDGWVWGGYNLFSDGFGWLVLFK